MITCSNETSSLIPIKYKDIYLFYYENYGCRICANILYIEKEMYRVGNSIENNWIYQPLRKHSSGRRDLRNRKRRHLIQKTPVAYPHGFRVPEMRQWNVVAAATTTEHFTTISAMVSTSHNRKSRMASHTPWRIVVRYPSRCSLDAFLSPFSDGRSSVVYQNIFVYIIVFW